MCRLSTFLVALMLSTQSSAQERQPVADGAKVEKLAGGFKFTEGPAPDAEGNVYFTDQPNDRILKWSTDGKLSTFMQPCGRSNGLCFDARGQPLGVRRREERAVAHRREDEGEDRRRQGLRRASCSTARTTSGCARTAASYFTDPFYKRDYWKRGPKEQDVQGGLLPVAGPGS